MPNAINNDQQNLKRRKSSVYENGLSNKLFTEKDVNEKVRGIGYAIRGPIAVRAEELELQLLQDQAANLQFTSLIRCNIGDASAMGIKPNVFYRQLLAYCACPEYHQDFPSDVKLLGERFLDACHGRSIGSYTTHPQGLEIVRHDVARFIEHRDGGVPSYMDDIFLFNGASDGIVSLMRVLSPNDSSLAPPGIMIPIPTFPFYTNVMRENKITEIPYNLDESHEWQISIKELQRALNNSGKCMPKMLVVINPGNPTGQVLPRENIQEIIQFAYDNKLVLVADEVYQDNIYDETKPFHSFKKVLSEMGDVFMKQELISIHSTSKGLMNECGARGGYMEFHNITRSVLRHLQKLMTVRSANSTTGQLAVYAMVNVPKPGDPSYGPYMEGRRETFSFLQERAALSYKSFNEIPGIVCNPIQGAMYAFPRLDLPIKYIQEAEKLGRHPDFHYCMQLLEEKGIVVVPGSGFGQAPGTFHFRTTILAPADLMTEMLEKVREFHTSLTEKYS